jgi:hypothetical protein
MTSSIPDKKPQETTTAEFKMHELIVRVQFDRQQLAQLRSRSMCAVSVKPENPIVNQGKSYPYIVFPARITPNLELEQTGDGFPCCNESQANEVIKVIEGKNQQVPHVGLVSAPGFFAIGTLTNIDLYQERLVLFKFHVAKTINGQRCGFALRLYKYFTDKPRELVLEEMLPTSNSRVAEKIMRQKDAELKAKVAIEKQKFLVAEAKTKSELNLIPSQLKVLSKAYPDTVVFLTNPKVANAEAAFAAYQRETLALTGHLVGALSKTEFKKAARVLRNASRRKNLALNAVEFELVAGWRLRGYDRMTPKGRFDALKQLGLEVSTPEAVRKICERLKLPSVRKRGAPRKSASE